MREIPNPKPVDFPTENYGEKIKTPHGINTLVKMHTEFIHCSFIYSRKTPQKKTKNHPSKKNIQKLK